MINEGIRDMDMGPGQGDLKECEVQFRRCLLTMIQDIMLTFGMRPVTYDSIKSHLNRAQGVYLWLNHNWQEWSSNSEMSDEYKFWETQQFFGPE